MDNNLYLQNGEYKYKGQPLRPGIMAEILLQLFSDKRFDRRTAIEETKQFHIDNGGTQGKMDLVSIFKRASLDIRKKGYDLQNVGYGEWILNTTNTDKIERVVSKKNENITNIVFDEEIGNGENSVYVYYYDIYKKYAELKGENKYPCKIGRTDVNPIDRIIGQAGTCQPEYPHCALIIRCQDSSVLETYFHSALKIRKCWIENAPGKEWFITNIEEIKKIYETLF